MQVERLKGLAAHLRELLADREVVVSHSQALDAIAAVAGMRNWPEVQAFPERVVGYDLDPAGSERLQRRLLRDHAFEIRPSLLLHLLEISEFQAVTPRRQGTERLIVTTTASGVGHLKVSRIADQVLDVRDQLVWGPVPSAPNPWAFYEARQTAYEADPFYADQLDDWDRATAAFEDWQALLAACRAYERVELWIDPMPNEQLLGLRTIAWLCDEPDLAGKLFVVHAESSLGERGFADLHTMNPEIRRIGDEDRELAARAWNAYRQPTPEAWYGLLGSDLDAFPFLRRAIRLLLGELPDVGTALGATERLLLKVVEPGDVEPCCFFHVNTRENAARVFDFWVEGRILDGLATCASPAVLGLQDGPFDLVLVEDRTRHDRYLRSRLSLSPFGGELLANRNDFARHNVIHRWWGGTLLTNDRLWRWNRVDECLIPPRS